MQKRGKTALTLVGFAVMLAALLALILLGMALRIFSGVFELLAAYF